MGARGCFVLPLKLCCYERALYVLTWYSMHHGILCVIQRDTQRDIHSCATLNVGGMRRRHSTCHTKVWHSCVSLASDVEGVWLRYDDACS